MPRAPWGREQGRSPLPSLLCQMQKTMRNTKVKKIQKYRSLQLQALGRQCWWVLVAKEPLRSSQFLLEPHGPTALPGQQEGQGCGDPRPTGPLGWPGQDQCPFLLAFRLRMCQTALEAAEAAARSVGTEEEMAMEVDVAEEEEMEVDVEEEEAMDVDPPSGGQARARHALPAGREGLLPPGWGWGWGWAGWSPLQGHGARCPPAGGTTAPSALP